jgi:hypothetical protein
MNNMIPDIGLPIQAGEKARDEVFVVYFDGFIKNTSEGVVRAMLRDEEDWLDKYPYLEIFRGMTQDELYNATMFTMPIDLLYEISDEKLTADEIRKDLDIILPSIIVSTSRITTFEFALHQLLLEDNVKKCYIFRDTHFFENEIEYIHQMYNDVIDKIEIFSGGFITLFNKFKPTTSFVTDYYLVSNYIVPETPKEELDNKIFIILNTFYTVHYEESTQMYVYNEEFAKVMNEYVKSNSFGMSAMYNLQLNSDELENALEIERTGKPIYLPSAEEVDEEIRRLEGYK